MVRKERLELSRLAALEPKSSASTNFATSAVGAGVIDAARQFQGREYSHRGRIVAITSICGPTALEGIAPLPEALSVIRVYKSMIYDIYMKLFIIFGTGTKDLKH